MDFSSFINRIKDIEKVPQKYFIVDPELPLEVYFGLDNSGRPTLLIEDIGKTFSPSEIPSTAQILVLSFERQGKACLSFSLLSSEHRSIFNTLCYDLVEATRKDTRQQALLCLLGRFVAWQNLLKNARPGIMSLQEQRGLAAELLVLIHFAQQKGIDVALDAWVGPFKMDKDFEFYDDWAEVKSCQISATSISISSIEQLDSPTEGELFVYHIDHSPENKEDAFSLEDIVQKARGYTTNAAMRRMLDSKLMLQKYMDNEPEYQKRRFCVHSHTIYKVSDSFPCLRRELLVAAITTCQYSISLPAIESFRME